MIAIICAMNNEIAFYKTVIKNLEVITHCNKEFFKGTIGDNEVVLTECGIGKVNSVINTSLLIHNFAPTVIINTGIAGGISPLETNDLFIGEEFVYGDFDLTMFNYEMGQVPGYEPRFVSETKYTSIFKKYLMDSNIKYTNGLIVTQDSFIKTIDQVSQFSNLKIATDMEGASIAHICKFYNISFFSIRIISDVIGSNNQISNYSEFEDKAAEHSSITTYNFLLKNKL
ncbi:MAG: 5'-methylthioadenosine/adenosylhomocysteine nucleosidase [bacterium]